MNFHGSHGMRKEANVEKVWEKILAQNRNFLYESSARKLQFAKTILPFGALL